MLMNGSPTMMAYQHRMTNNGMPLTMYELRRTMDNVQILADQ